MAQGIPSNKARILIKQEFSLDKIGIQITLGKKYIKKHRGYVIISIGGIQWVPYKKKKSNRMSWDKLIQHITS